MPKTIQQLEYELTGRKRIKYACFSASARYGYIVITSIGSFYSKRTNRGVKIN